MLAKVFPPDLVDRVVDEAGAREQRKRTLPARVVVYLLLAMVLFFQSGYGDVWDKLVQGLRSHMKRPVKLLQVLRLVRAWFDRFVVVSVRVRGRAGLASCPWIAARSREPAAGVTGARSARAATPQAPLAPGPVSR